MLQKLKEGGRELLHRGIDYLQAKFPPNRIAIAATSLVFAPAAAWISGWVGANIPGAELPPGVISGLAGAGFLAALRLGYKWLDRWQEEERSNDRIWESERMAEIAAGERPGTRSLVGAIDKP